MDDDDEEQQPRGLRRIRRHQGTFGVRLCVISAVTASSDEKSTNGSIWICLYRAVSLWPTLVTTPIWIPCGKSDGYLLERVTAVTIKSSARTFCSLRSKSRIREPYSWHCRT